MRILQLCNKIPWPLNEGGSIAINQIGSGLRNAGHQVDVLCIETPKFGVRLSDLPEEFRSRFNVQGVRIDTRVKSVGAFLNLFSSLPYNITRFVSADFEEKIKEILKETTYDIIQFESVYMAPYIEVFRNLSKAHLVLRAHNIEYLIWERYAANQKNPLKRIYIQIMKNRLKKYEQNVFPQFDAIIPITPNDEKYIADTGCKTPTLVFPATLFPSDSFNHVKADKNTVCHIGTMDWMPNQEGIFWFLREIWPLILTMNPDARLRLAGRNMPDDISQWNGRDQILIAGEVNDSAAFIASSEVMIVPLLSGSGMRVKIIEGMSLGKAIVATSIAAEGINVSHCENILIADAPEEFAKAVVSLLTDSELRVSIEISAKKLIFEQYNPATLISKLTGFYEQLCNA
ncbi:MAG: glycosyltransferase family 4 protein [Bacteroidetes bacterium]|nr:glycosyltransferase family 4 protein [Bacteroidota bacterium]MBU1718998.1 glycosyltransferase family 4 protein [Bacteroidota bacterium]